MKKFPAPASTGDVLEVTAKEHRLMLLDLQSRNDKEVVSETSHSDIFV